MKAEIEYLEGIFKAQKELFDSHGYCLGRTKESFERDLLTLESIKKYVYSQNLPTKRNATKAYTRAH